MSGQRTLAAGRIARWILLSCTLFGLAAMHTLGHTGPRPGTHHRLDPAAMIVVSTVHGAAIAPAIAPAIVPAECSDDHCDGHGGMSGWSVCLAILSGFVAVVLLMALLSWLLAGRGRTREKIFGHPLVPRAPPRRPAGLTLASVAVLRI